jgi:hypothetical protein
MGLSAMTRFRTVDRLLAVLAALLIGLYFLLLARPALDNYFSADDFQNLWRAWFFPLSSLLKANLLFFRTSNFIRPMAADWYRLIFHFAGPNPFWFRAANLVILLANIFLTYAVARRLSDSRESGLMTALFISYSRPMTYLYFDTAFIFDVLCFFFYFSAFLFYLKVRQQGRLLRAWEIAVCCMIFVCALNAKEIAVTLPAMFLLYELLWSPPSSLGPRSLMRYSVREGRTALITGGFVITMAIGRSLGPQSLLQVPAYRPIFTWHQFLLTTGTFLSQATGGHDPWGQRRVLVIWAALLAAAWISRRRELRFAWFFITLSPIPIAFIEPRGTPQYYIPWFGWMFFAAILLVTPVIYLTERISSDRLLLPRIRGAVLLIGLIAILYPFYRRLGWNNVNSIIPESLPLRNAAFELHRLEPKLKPKARVLLLKNPIFTGYTLNFIVLTTYRDRDLYIYDVKQEGRIPTQAEMATFDYIFDYRRGHYVELRGSHHGPVDFGPFTIDSLQPSCTGAKRPFNMTPDGRQSSVVVFGKSIPDHSTILWNGQPLRTTVGGTFAAGIVPREFYESPGEVAVTVRDGDEGEISNALDFTVYPDTEPQPVIAGLYPSGTAPGKSFNPQPGGESALGIGGDKFLPGVALFFDGTKLKTTFGNSTSISGIVPAALFAGAGSHQVWAVNPDGKRSRPLVFKVAQ